MCGAAESASGSARYWPTSRLVKVKLFPSSVLFPEYYFSEALSLYMLKLGVWVERECVKGKIQENTVLIFLINIVIHSSTYARAQTTL